MTARASENRKTGVRVGYDMGGVRDLEDLRERCRVDDITGCWHWGLANSGNGAPSLWIPELRRRLSLGGAVGFLSTGKDPKGQIWHVTCDTPNCGNPAHRSRGTKSSQMLRSNALRDPVVRARITKTIREGSKLSEAECEAIRNDPRKLADIAADYGIHLSYVSVIRRGIARKPLAVKNASAFHWSPTP